MPDFDTLGADGEILIELGPIYIFIYTYLNICIVMYTYVCMCTCIYVYTYICVNRSMPDFDTSGADGKILVELGIFI
jgi:hypothetical protein